MDADASHFAKNQVYKFIHYDYNDHVFDSLHATNIVDHINNLDLHIDGCLTFWEDCGPLAANVCKVMGLRGKWCLCLISLRSMSKPLCFSAI